MKILFISDTHIGAKRYNIEFFEDAILESFESQLQLAVKENVDCILHGGDLFDSVHVSASNLYKTIELLNKYLKDIPMYCIPGNHDIKGFDINTSYLKVLSTSIDNFHLMTLGDILELNDDVHVCMMPYVYPSKSLKQNKSLNDIVKELGSKMKPGVFKILLAHQDIASLAYSLNIENEFILDPEVTSKYFDLTLLGHYHNATLYDKDYKYMYVGSSFPLSFKQARSPKGSYLIEFNGNRLKNIKFINNKIPYNFKEIEIDYDKIKSIDSILNKIKKEVDKSTILKLKITTSISTNVIVIKELLNSTIKPQLKDNITKLITEVKVESNIIINDIELKSKLSKIDPNNFEESTWLTIAKEFKLDDTITKNLFELYKSLQNEDLPKTKSALMKKILPKLRQAIDL